MSSLDREGAISENKPASGPVAQWLEPAAHNGLVGGSSPPGPTSLRSLRELRLGKPRRAVAQRAKAAAPKPQGRRRACCRELKLGQRRAVPERPRRLTRSKTPLS